MSIAAKFFETFSGLERAHGQYTLGKTTRTGKVQGRAVTLKEPTTVELWESHLAGEYGLGIQPLRDDGTCVFGAVDIDDHDVNHERLDHRLEELKLPIVVCRSKSGGAHLYLFGSEPLDAQLLQTKLMEIATAVGYAGVEVFPKQTRLASEQDFGNWINMPYFGGEDSTRYAVRHDEILTPKQFLELVEKVKIDGATLEALEFQTPSEDSEELLGGPPCLQTLAYRGFPEGTRNNALFNLAVYLRKRYGDSGWEELLDEMNTLFMQPPLGHREVAVVVKQVGRKEYGYMCRQPPIASVCNKQLCLKREFGVAGASDDPGVAFGQLTKLLTKPPVYFWSVNGARVELTGDELMNQGKLQRRCVEELNYWPRTVRSNRWYEIVQEHLANVEELDVPDDATPAGQFWSFIVDYVTDTPPAREFREILRGKHWTDEEEQRTYFRLKDLIAFIRRKGETRFTNRSAAVHLRVNDDAENHFKKIEGRGTNLWSVPTPTNLMKPYTVPLKDDGGKF